MNYSKLCGELGRRVLVLQRLNILRKKDSACSKKRSPRTSHSPLSLSLFEHQPKTRSVDVKAERVVLKDNLVNNRFSRDNVAGTRILIGNVTGCNVERG